MRPLLCGVILAFPAGLASAADMPPVIVKQQDADIVMGADRHATSTLRLRLQATDDAAAAWLPEFGVYVDTTAGVAPFGVLPFEEYGKPVVHAVASGRAVRQTPVLPAGLASVALKTVARLDREGKVTGESTVTAAGPPALRLSGIGSSPKSSD